MKNAILIRILWLFLATLILGCQSGGSNNKGNNKGNEIVPLKGNLNLSLLNTIDLKCDSDGASGISIDDQATTMPVGTSHAATAYLQCNNGTKYDITPYVAWRTSDEKILTVSNSEDNKGYVSAISPGSAKITIVWDAYSTSKDVSVMNAVVKSVIISAANIPNGGSIQATLKGVYSDGSSAEIDPHQAIWSSSNLEIANVIGGLISGIAEGNTVITATYQGVSTTYTATVVKGKVTGIKIANINDLNFITGIPSSVPLQVNLLLSDGTTEPASMNNIQCDLSTSAAFMLIKSSCSLSNNNVEGSAKVTVNYILDGKVEYTDQAAVSSSAQNIKSLEVTTSDINQTLPIFIGEKYHYMIKAILNDNRAIDLTHTLGLLASDITADSSLSAFFSLKTPALNEKEGLVVAKAIKVTGDPLYLYAQIGAIKSNKIVINKIINNSMTFQDLSNFAAILESGHNSWLLISQDLKLNGDGNFETYGTDNMDAFRDMVGPVRFTPLSKEQSDSIEAKNINVIDGKSFDLGKLAPSDFLEFDFTDAYVNSTTMCNNTDLNEPIGAVSISVSSTDSSSQTNSLGTTVTAGVEVEGDFVFEKTKVKLDIAVREDKSWTVSHTNTVTQTLTGASILIPGHSAAVVVGALSSNLINSYYDIYLPIRKDMFAPFLFISIKGVPAYPLPAGDTIPNFYTLGKLPQADQFFKRAENGDLMLRTRLFYTSNKATGGVVKVFIYKQGENSTVDKICFGGNNLKRGKSNQVVDKNVHELIKHDLLKRSPTAIYNSL